MSLQVVHDVGTSVSVRDGAVEVFQLVYGGKPKPFVHPLRTPASGQILTNFEPSDHVWHRGLWFTFKFINGENFWEEGRDPNEGTQVAGVPTTGFEDGTLALNLPVYWTRKTGEVIVNELRHLEYRRRSHTSYTLDHTSRLTINADLLLDRTPFTTWGGYGGLCFRATRNWLDTKIHLSDGTETVRPTGLPAKWGALSGKLDGGPGLIATVAVLDHPDNPRHPVPFYGSANNPGHYLTPAPLFHEPMKVAKGTTLTFAYRVLVEESAFAAARLDELYEDFARG